MEATNGEAAGRMWQAGVIWCKSARAEHQGGEREEAKATGVIWRKCYTADDEKTCEEYTSGSYSSLSSSWDWALHMATWQTVWYTGP